MLQFYEMTLNKRFVTNTIYDVNEKKAWLWLWINIGNILDMQNEHFSYDFDDNADIKRIMNDIDIMLYSIFR